MSTKKCTKCGVTKELDLFHKHRTTKDKRGSWCKECSLNRWRNVSREKKREYKLYHKYKITASEYAEMYTRQEGACAICKEKHATLCVDHCHDTDKVRGLLCIRCNWGVGDFRNNETFLRRAADYLESTR